MSIRANREACSTVCFAPWRCGTPRVKGHEETLRDAKSRDEATLGPVEFRMDFVLKLTRGTDHPTTFSVVPSPDRYERAERDGRSGWRDRLDGLFFTNEVVADVVRRLSDMPMGFQQQQLGNAGEYVRARVAEIEAMLDGHLGQATFEDPSEEFLESLADDRLSFVILVVDAVGSTQLAQRLTAEDYARVMSTVLTELSYLVPAFHGHVLKYTGDGLIAYFAEPSFVIKNDLGIDCAFTMRRLIAEGVNPTLEMRGWPAIGVRVGIDSGEAIVVTMGHKSTKQHKDIIGATVNLAAKIQAVAPPGSIVVGETVDRNLHVSWRTQLQEIQPGGDWPYNGKNGEPYKVFRLGRDPEAGARVDE